MKTVVTIIGMLLASMCAFGYNLKTGSDMVITSPVSGDLYISGGNITINSPVHGDLVVAGGTVVINDTITGDIIAGGGKITINGYAADDIRCAGGEITIAGTVAGDVVAAGGTISITNAGNVLGGVLVGAGTATLNGAVSQDVRIAGGEIVINSTVGGNLECRGGDIKINGVVRGTSLLAARNIQVGTTAAFYNDVRFWNEAGHMAWGSSIRQGKAILDPTLKVSMPSLRFLGFASFLALVWYIGAAFLMILLVHYFMRGIMDKAATRQQIVSGRSLLYGLLFATAVPVAILICFVTIIGIPIGVLLLLLYAVIMLLGSVFASVLITGYLQRTKGYKWGSLRFAGIALLIMLLFKLATAAVPLVGWLVASIIVLSCFGAILRTIPWRRGQVRA